MNISYDNILKDFSKFVYSDHKPLEQIKVQLKGFYYNNENKKISNVVSKFYSKNLNDNFKDDFPCLIPWIDTKMWEVFKSRTGFSFPKEISSDKVKFTSGSNVLQISSNEFRSFRRESEFSTRQCIESYTSRERRLPSVQRNCIGRSGIEAAKILKILTNGRTNTLKGSSGRIQSVIDTSKNTNSGYPFYKKKNSDLCIKDTISWLNNIFKKPNLYSLMKNPLMENPISIFYRTQPSVKEEENSVKIKIRQVWGLPQRIICLEYYFFSGILENVFKNNVYGENVIYSSGLTNYEISEKIISKIRSNMSINKELSLYSMDYSKFDRNIPSFAIDLFYSIVKEELTFQNPDEEKLFHLLRFYIKHAPFVYKDQLFYKTNGIPSGSYITNLIDTWWNLTMWIYSERIANYYRKNLNLFLNKDDITNLDFNEIDNFKIFDKSIGICGDDTVILTDRIHIHIMKLICVSLGMSITENQICNDPTKPFYFLGRNWSYANEPIQTDLYMFSHIVIRTKFYKEEELEGLKLKYLTPVRILSICMQFSNGIDFINRFLNDFEKLNNYLEISTGFYLLKEYPLSKKYNFINKIDSKSWQRM